MLVPLSIFSNLSWVVGEGKGDPRALVLPSARGEWRGVKFALDKGPGLGLRWRRFETFQARPGCASVPRLIGWLRFTCRSDYRSHRPASPEGFCGFSSAAAGGPLWQQAAPHPRGCRPGTRRFLSQPRPWAEGARRGFPSFCKPRRILSVGGLGGTKSPQEV